MTTHPGKSLYALLVGIDNYTSFPLKGAVNDVHTFSNVLLELAKDKSFLLYEPQTLINNQATKERITSSFLHHLSKGKSGDIALFYFAGHGACEKTQIFAFANSSIEGNINCIICHDKGKPISELGGDMRIADKEFRYLIKQLSDQGLEVILIFDCCHSGQNIRIAGKSQARRISTMTLPAREWDQFIFSTDSSIPLSSLEQGYLNDTFPEGNYIQMGACRNIEEALENIDSHGKYSGNFTSALTDILTKSSGNITYNELNKRIFNRLKQDGPDPQHPQMIITGKLSAYRNQCFLTHLPISKASSEAPISFNSANNEYRLGMGGLHGIPEDDAAQNLQIQVFARNEPDRIYRAATKQVWPAYSLIEFQDGNPPNPSGLLYGKVRHSAPFSLSVFLYGTVDTVDQLLKHLHQLSQKTPNTYFQIVFEEANADLTISITPQHFILTKVFDPGKIITQPIQINSHGMIHAIRILYNRLIHIAKWSSLVVKDVIPKPPKATFSLQYPVELRVYQQVSTEFGDKEFLHQLKGGKLPIHLTKGLDDFYIKQADPTTHIRFELINHSEQRLCCGLLHQSQEFGINNLFENHSGWLEPGQTMQSKGSHNSPYFEFYLPDYVRLHRWKGLQEYLKLIVSEKQWSAAEFEMNDLPTATDSGQLKGSLVWPSTSAQEVFSIQWYTMTVDMFIYNHLEERSRFYQDKDSYL